MAWALLRAGPMRRQRLPRASQTTKAWPRADSCARVAGRDAVLDRKHQAATARKFQRLCGLGSARRPACGRVARVITRLDWPSSGRSMDHHRTGTDLRFSENEEGQEVVL